MKCPKCGYISFDYNQICPKCSKDIGNEQKKLNLPAFKPDPPYLLEALTGSASESRIGLEPGTFVESPDMEPVIGAAMDDTGVAMDDTGVMRKASLFGKNDEELEMEMEGQASEAPAMESGDSIETEISAVDLSEIEMETEGENQDALSFDLGDLPDEIEITDPPPGPADAIGDGTVAISGVTPVIEDMGLGSSPDEEISLDLDEVSDESLEAAMALEKEELELALDLEALSENARDLDEISLEPGNEFEEGSFDLSEMGMDEAGKGPEAEEGPFNDSEMLTVELDSEKKEKSEDP
ncbi:MAG: hypothetical protein WAL98_03955 [Desulfatiglandaceae bacterium]|jgi:uncharacterized protein YfcZ (UPF0381/DUF406 family)